MKKLLLFAFVFALCIGAADAQSNGRNRQKERVTKHSKQNAHQMNRAGSMNRFYQELNLSPNQKSQADQLTSELKNDLQYIRRNNSLSQDQKKTQMTGLLQQHHANFRNILTAEQARKFDSMVNDMKHKANRGTASSRSYENGTTAGGNSLLNLLGGNISLGSIMGSNSPVSGILGNNFSLGDILGGLSLESILSILSGLLI